MADKQYFQDYMPGGICFGCGGNNSAGLHIKSYWEGDMAVCEWWPQSHHQGWSGLTCGGIIATVVDCHGIATAMATALRNEHRALGSEPHYLFATGALSLKFLKPSSSQQMLRLQAQVTAVKLAKKYTLTCEVYCDNEKTVEAQMVVLLVYRSDQPEQANECFRPS